MGANPITYAEILAWSNLRLISLRTFEIDLLLALDAVCMADAAEREKR